MTNLTIESMKWAKQGLVYCPDNSLIWAKHYACLPTPVLMSPERLRIFLAFCDENMIGRIGYIDVEPNNPKNILAISQKPILDIGKPGRFDENGVVPASVLAVDDKLYMYYVGYQRGQKVRYYQFGGLAISNDGGDTFKRAQEMPVLDRSNDESLNRTAPFVILENGRFRMWYVGGSKWTTVNGKAMPIYNVRYIESDDGLNWPSSGQICFDFQNDDEYVIGRPWVIKSADSYKMFLSSRTRSKDYRLGYAESKDGISWRRFDQMIDIDKSAEGWDSQMLAYASIFNWEEKTYMFYNGNDCGRSGFGCAVLMH